LHTGIPESFVKSGVRGFQPFEVIAAGGLVEGWRIPISHENFARDIARRRGSGRLACGKGEDE